MHENVAAAAIDLLLPNVVDGLCQLSMFVFKFPNVVSKIFMGRPKAIYEGFVRWFLGDLIDGRAKSW